MHRTKISLSYELAGQRIGTNEVDDGIWIVSYMHYDLGYIDLEQKTLKTPRQPVGARLLPMTWARAVTDVSGPYKRIRSSERGTRTPDQRIMIPLL